MVEFFLGTHRPNWLAQVTTPLFVSHRHLRGRRLLPRARARWALDSGAFSELSLEGGWRESAASYVGAVRRYREEIGQLAWAAPMDWMCEPWLLRKTGLTVRLHQELTVENYLRLRWLAPELPFIPVLQGWEVADYHRHADLYERLGVDLRATLVGVGSICRRQSSTEIDALMVVLRNRGYRLHGFGVKVGGLAHYRESLFSADSMAWSYRARRIGRPLPGCVGHRNCANCQRFALEWLAHLQL